jgi:hypothetical protein
MLFQSSVPQIFQNMNLKLYSADNSVRKAEAAKRLNFYHDSQLEYLEAQLDELFADPSKMLKVSLNIVKKVINSLAQIYTQPPVRAIEGSARDREIYKQIVCDSRLDLKLKQMSRYCKLLKTLLVRVVWRNDHIDLDIITGNLLDVETGDTPEDLKLVMITDYGNSDKVEDVEYSLWSPSTWKRLDYQGNIIDSKPNPYNVLPFVPIFDYPPISNNFWLPGGDDLISQQEAINIKLVDLLHLLYFQSFGVGFIKGAEDIGALISIGPGALVELPTGGEIGYTSQKAEIRAVVEAIDKLLKWCCVCQGLSASAVSTDPSEASGVSKVWDSVELAEMRVEDKILWSGYERQLFDLIRIVHNTHSKDKLLDSAKLKVNFADPARPTVSPLDEAQSYSEYFKMGVMSPVDIIMQKDKDLRSREEALERLKQIKNETQQLAPQGVKMER